jgi:hypothetical protein
MSEWDKVMKYFELAELNNELAEASMKDMEDNLATVVDELQDIHKMIKALKRQLGIST